MKRSSERRAKRWLIQELTRCIDQRIKAPLMKEITTSSAGLSNPLLLPLKA